eukprot:9443883-Pyramimonas_sp.AAC.1
MCIRDSPPPPPPPRWLPNVAPPRPRAAFCPAAARGGGPRHTGAPRPTEGRRGQGRPPSPAWHRRERRQRAAARRRLRAAGDL